MNSGASHRPSTTPKSDHAQIPKPRGVQRGKQGHFAQTEIELEEQEPLVLPATPELLESEDWENDYADQDELSAISAEELADPFFAPESSEVYALPVRWIWFDEKKGQKGHSHLLWGALRFGQHLRELELFRRCVEQTLECLADEEKRLSEVEDFFSSLPPPTPHDVVGFFYKKSLSGLYQRGGKEKTQWLKELERFSIAIPKTGDVEGEMSFLFANNLIAKQGQGRDSLPDALFRRWFKAFINHEDWKSAHMSSESLDTLVETWCQFFESRARIQQNAMPWDPIPFSRHDFDKEKTKAYIQRNKLSEWRLLLKGWEAKQWS